MGRPERDSACGIGWGFVIFNLKEILKMKKILTLVVMIITFCLTPVIAKDLNGKVTIDLKDNPQKIEYVEVITSKSKFRIYPCGQIKKLEWKEIHANEDNQAPGITWADGSNGICVDSNGIISSCP